MSASDNVDTVKAIYGAFGTADVATILETVTDDVDWATEGERDVAPWYGQRTGKEQVASFFRDIGGAVEVQEFTPLSFAANDENEVHTMIRFPDQITPNRTRRGDESAPLLALSRWQSRVLPRI